MAFLDELGQGLQAGAGALNAYNLRSEAVGKQNAIANLGAKLQAGDIKGAIGDAASMGDTDTLLKLMTLDQQREADAKIGPLLGGDAAPTAPSAAAPLQQLGQPQQIGANLPRGLRNMNPGNIEAGPFAQGQPGYAGDDGRFAKFDTLEHGVGAQSALLGRYADKGINTVAGVVNRWAPPSENGAASANYTNFVARKLGVDPNAPIDLRDPEITTRLASAMGEFETGRPVGLGGGQPVQVADASGGVPASAGGQGAAGGVDALNARLSTLTRLLASPNISASARAAVQAQIENTRNMISRSDRQEDVSLRRQERVDLRQERTQARQDTREQRDVGFLNRAREAEADRLGLQGDERLQYVTSGKVPLQGEKQTEAQTNAATFATRMSEAEKIIADPAIYGAGLGAAGATRDIAGSVPVLGNMAVGAAPGGANYQKFTQAKRDFVNAILRKESGAAITEAEFVNADKQYFPKPGDGPEVIAQKAANRATAIDTIAAGGTPSFKKEFAAKRGTAPQAAPPNDFPDARRATNGKWYVQKGDGFYEVTP